MDLSQQQLAMAAKDFFEGKAVPTGIPAIDQVLPGGLPVPSFNLFGGRSSSGKTWFLVEMARRALNAGHPVVFFSLEMTTTQVVRRLAQLEFGLGVKEVAERMAIDYQFNADEEGNLAAQYTRRFSKLVVMPPGPTTVTDIKVATEQAGALFGAPPLVIVDHVGILKKTSQYTPEGKKEAQACEELKVLSTELGVAIIGISQLNKGQEGSNVGHRPVTINDFYGGPEHHTDVMLGLYRPEMDPDLLGRPESFPSHEAWMETQARLDKVRGQVIVQVVKNRHGPSLPGGAAMRYHLETGQYRDEEES